MNIGVFYKGKRGNMKKSFILMMLFSFISVMPCFALKIIVNESTDRTVPSRSSSPSELYEDYNEQEYTEEIEHNEEQQSNINQSVYNDEKYEQVYRPLLGANIRPELVGTTWGYAVNNPQTNKEEHIQPANNVNNEINQGKEILVKRFLREAADYYVIDTINRPDEAVPAGFEEIVQD